MVFLDGLNNYQMIVSSIACFAHKFLATTGEHNWVKTPFLVEP